MIFTPTDIDRNFDAHDNSRGRTYQIQGRVKDIRVERGGAIIFASVQGMAAKPYRVEIEIKKKPGGLLITSHCTCPVGYMCKHGVAALYEAIAYEGRKHERIGQHRTKAPAAASGLSERTRQWLASLDKVTPPSTAPDDDRVVYLLTEEATEPSYLLSVTAAIQHKLRDGCWGKPRPQTFFQIHLLGETSSVVTKEDQAVLSLARHAAGNNFRTMTGWTSPEDGEIVDLFMRRILATGRTFLDANTQKPLSLAEPIKVELSWDLDETGYQRPSLALPRPGLLTFLAPSPWYVDPLSGEAGPLRYPLEADMVRRFLDVGPVGEKEAALIRDRLSKTKSRFPAPAHLASSKAVAEPPAVHLDLVRIPSIQPEEGPGTEALAFVRFLYNGHSVHPLAPLTQKVQERAGDTITLKTRNDTAEQKAIDRLMACELIPHPLYAPDQTSRLDPRGYALVPSPDASPWYWQDFIQDVAPRLRAEGYSVHIATDFESEIIEPDTDDIDADFTQNGEWWFSLDLGIKVGGQRIPLLPILVAMLRRLRSDSDIDRLTSTGKCYAPLPDGRQIALPSERIRTILKTLVELFEEKPLDKNGQLRVPVDLAAAFVKLESITHKRWLGEGKLRQLVEKLNDFEGIQHLPLPKGLKAQLRPYQTDGYNWLQFLSTYGLSGILADDMGLGKTIQTLAFILSLKEKKKLDAPCLIVMPTSLIANWQAEAERFTPALRTLTLHGKDRADAYDDIPKADLVFTTYPLLPRDGHKLKDMTWSLVVLDEAQAIKNPSAKATQAACALQARQRLCLTGTPVENHLGEAWSLFTFLMPGLLGDNKKFTRSYRTPIEKGGDGERKTLLAKRLRPFVLRRLKSGVEKELPPKTEMIRRVSLTDAQRDLYEAVRHVMNERVREEIEAKGMARSQIVILDALLKLRQTCCDPRLVKLEAARRVKESAKLQELMEMLPTLIEDGRRILLFSQFTSMLDLVVPELEKAGIPFVELRGTTKDRSTPIKRFQNGDVPLFLISLKAGGTGLNLTAADTVIHYDPWWNPSVENQATDRAHRIGQTKPVFVYKLIAEGTVEERILDLQQKKAGLAAALFGDNPAAAASLTSEDLQWLMG